ncbi:MAG: NAD(P)/FAD-dependent oxidoreductase [Candidatus Rifleibacteriota bacterium]
MKTQLLIIGGGPAGLMAAIKAADAGINCIIAESMKKPALKLGLTGKGRGNITNNADYKDFLQHFNNRGRFLKSAFKQFFNADLLNFIHSIGLKTVNERGGRVFTASGKAPEISRRLIKTATQKGVKILTDTRIVKLETKNKYCTKAHTSNNRIIEARAFIIATGGQSYPLTGSTGDGYKLAKDQGHKIQKVYPSLVALKPAKKLPETLEGLTLKNIEASLLVNEKKVQSLIGEMTFLDGYLAGPLIITLSRIAVPAIKEGKEVEVSIDLKPALDHKKLDNRILRDLDDKSIKTLDMLLKRLFPASLSGLCYNACKLNPSDLCSEFRAEKRKALRNWIKDLRFKITEAGPWSQAIVTAGGISTAEIDPLSMKSKIVHNLYFAGEVIDIDADTGGYNLQAAFSTGWLAGKRASEHILSK